MSQSKAKREAQRWRKQQAAIKKERADGLFKAINISAVILSISGFLFRHDLKWLPLSVVLLMLATMIALKLYNKAVTFDSHAWHSLLPATICLLLCINVTHTPDSLHVIWNKVFIVMGIFAAMVIWIVADAPISKGFKIFTVIFCTTLSVAPSVGIVYYFNYAFDFSTPESRPYTITRKAIQGRKGRTYHVEFTPAWMENGMTIRADVTPGYYESVEIQDKKEIAMHKGALGIRWYKLRGEH